MNFMKNLTVELIPVVLVGILSGAVTGMSAYMAVRTDVIILTVNQGLILDAIVKDSKEGRDMYEGLKEHDVRLAVLEAIERSR